jgi:hypothetical protein
VFLQKNGASNNGRGSQDVFIGEFFYMFD